MLPDVDHIKGFAVKVKLETRAVQTITLEYSPEILEYLYDVMQVQEAIGETRAHPRDRVPPHKRVHTPQPGVSYVYSGPQKGKFRAQLRKDLAGRTSGYFKEEEAATTFVIDGSPRQGDARDIEHSAPDSACVQLFV